MVPRRLAGFLAAFGSLLLPGASRAAGPRQAESDLPEAARRGDVARLEALLRQGAAVDARDEAGLTPLMEAASPEAARVLLRAGADVNASTRSGWTALMQAAAAGRLETVRRLLEAGASLDARDRLWGTPLDVANQRRQGEVARLLRARGARGSGRSVGDRVCVRPWRGDGVCGVIEAVDGQRIQIRIDSLVGCDGGCGGPEAECSSGKVVGGVGGVGVGTLLGTKSWCVTHTGLQARGTP